jgi:hypothetical protein
MQGRTVSEATRDRRRAEERRRSREEAQRWAAELVTRFCAALSADERTAVLAELDLPHVLDEEAALVLYLAQPQLASAFIQRHLPRGRRADDTSSPWHRLMGQAQARGDEALYFALYRAQATPEQWTRDTSQLASRVADPQLLCAELRRRHPNRWRPDVGPQLAQLARERGEHLLPYLLENAHEVWSAGRRFGYEQITDLARRGGWLDLWAAVLGSYASTAEYDREVLSLVQEPSMPEPELSRRLLLLAGAGPGRRPGGRVKPLRDTTLLALYDRFPQLARGAFRDQLDPSPTRPRSGLMELAIERRDDELIDLVAARLAVRAERSGAERLLQVAAITARYLETAASDMAALGLRASGILRCVPPRSIHNRHELVRRNPLARLLFERAAEACLATPEAAADLLRAQDDHVCAIAVRALTSDDPRAIVLARQKRELLLGALERSLPRAVTRQALRTLDRLADEPAVAAQLLRWARRALARRSPDDALLALVARQLSRHPFLQEAGENPTVYRRAAK